LARILFPELSSRSLGALCDHLLIDIYDRHRAAGDAEATVYVLKHLLKKVRAEHGISQWDELQVFLSSGPLQLPPGINLSEVAHLPEAPGSYVLKGFDGCPLFTGKSTNIRRRIKDLFKRSNQSKRSNRFRETARSIEILPSQAVSLS
jgi:DNA polymerase-3 subunit epsilon